MDTLKEAGCDKIYKEKITGTKKDRPELDKLLEELRSGDTIIVSDLTRLSRSTKDLFNLIEQIESKGVYKKLEGIMAGYYNTTGQVIVYLHGRNKPV